jgi:hypothetical protein
MVAKAVATRMTGQPPPIKLHYSGAVFRKERARAGRHKELYQVGLETIGVADIWADTGVTPDKHIAFYCGTVWRASEAFINAYLMGWPRISVYDGGWFEWSSHPDNPVETGIPAGQKP